MQIRLLGDLTVASAIYTIVVRHPRMRKDSAADWSDHRLQRHGLQTVDELSDIMESRPEKEMFIYTPNEPPKMHGDPLHRRASRKRLPRPCKTCARGGSSSIAMRRIGSA